MENPQQPQQQINIDLKNTTSLETGSGKKIFQQGFLLRKVSKFIAGTEQDAILPITVMYDPETGKIEKSTLPQDLHDEFENDLI